MPFPPATFDGALWLWRRLTWLFGTCATELRRSNGGLGYPWSSLFVLQANAGIAGPWRRERETALILLGPVPTSPADQGFARWGCCGTPSALGRSGRL